MIKGNNRRVEQFQWSEINPTQLYCFNHSQPHLSSLFLSHCTMIHSYMHKLKIMNDSNKIQKPSVAFKESQIKYQPNLTKVYI